MTKILWHSETPFTPSGYGNQTERITSGLAEKGFEMGLLGWQYVGNKLVMPPNRRQLFSGAGGFGAETTPFVIEEFKPDGVICLGDWWMNSYVHHLPRKHDFWSSHWFPIDGIPFGDHSKWSDAFNSANLIVNMSQFGHQQFQQGVEYAMKNNKPVTLENTMIPHGIDTEIYKRASDEEIAEEKEFLEIHPDAMVIGCVARNQPRKNYPRLIETFSKWAKERHFTEKDVVLYLHCSPTDSAGWSLDYLRRGYDMEKQIILNKLLNVPSFGIAPERMKNFYSIMDVKILPTAGEGFGLPTAEALSCEVPLAITNFTNSAEFMRMSGRYVLEREVYEDHISTYTGEFINPKGEDNPYNFIKADNGWLIPYDDLFTHKGNVNRVTISRKGMKSWFDEVFYLFSEEKYKLESMGKIGRKLVKRFFDMPLVINAWAKTIEHMEEDWGNRSLKSMPPLHAFDETYMINRKFDANQPYCKTEINSMLESIRSDKNMTDIYTALDVGCGSGETMRRLNREGFITMGCDISPEAVKFCRKEGLTAVLANGETLREDLNSYNINWFFDIVLSQHTMEHCDNWERFVKNCCISARKAVYIAVPHDNMHDKTHVKRYLEETMNDIRSFVESENFTESIGKWKFSYNKVGDKFNTVSYIIILKKEHS